MKLKPLIPTITTLSIATIGLTACNPKPTYVAIPSEYYIIDSEGTLTGLQEKDYSKYDAIAIPNNVISVNLIDKASEQEANFNSIKTITYQENSKWRNIGLNSASVGFANFHNVETIVLPNTVEYASYTDETGISGHAFANLPKLSTIDVSSYTSAPLWLKPTCFIDVPNKGKFIVVNNQVKSYIERIMLTSELFKSWTVEVK